MPTRIPASERTSQKLDELLTQGVADGDARAELLKLAVRKIVEEALEAEVAEAVGREYYKNGAAPGAGYRNGYRRDRLRTAEGPIDYGVPQVTDRTEPFVSRVRAGLAGRTAELERLAVEMFARGLSTRDIEEVFRDATGGSLLSRTAVSQVAERLWQEYEAFATPGSQRVRRGLLLGGRRGRAAACRAAPRSRAVRLGDHRGRAQGVAARGARDEGRHRQLHRPSSRTSSAAAWRIPCWSSPTERRGSFGPWRPAFRALRQRCLVHRLRNLHSKAPDSQWPEIAIRARACYEAASPALATLLRDDFVQVYGRELPTVVQCFALSPAPFVVGETRKDLVAPARR